MNKASSQTSLPITLPEASKRKTRPMIIHMPIGEGVQPMSFRPPLELHTELKKRALSAGVSMQRIIEVALRDYFGRVHD